jgi:hypothetical protein
LSDFNFIYTFTLTFILFTLNSATIEITYNGMITWGRIKKRNQSTLRAGDPSSKAVFIRAPYEEIWLQFIHTQCDYTATDGYRRARLMLTGYGWTMEAREGDQYQQEARTQ